MRTLGVSFGFVLLAAIAVQVSTAEDFYAAQTAQGADTGADVGNAHSVDWFNTAGSWGDGAGKISNGDTVYLSGTITNGLWIQGDGVTVKFLAGSKVSSPVGSGGATGNPLLANYLIYCANRSDVTIDGQGAGIIECTDNGSERSYQLLVKMIQADSCSNLTVRGLFFKNGYVHTLKSDASLDEGLQAGLKTAQALGIYTVENCVFSNVCWAVSASASGANTTTITVRSNYFINFDHGVAIGSGTNQPLNINIASNIFDTTANWDTDANRYHHDGIHYYGNAFNPTNFVISHNIFKNDWGSNNTAHVFLETGPRNVLAYNNVFIQWPGNKLNNGFFNFVGTGSRIFNNTFLGSGDVVNSMALLVYGTDMQLVNNLVSGVTTFLTSISGTGVQFSAISNNLYASQISGGNSMWRLNLTNYNTLTDWQTAIGDGNSLYATNSSVNANGTLASSSVAIDGGANLNDLFTTDATGITRTGTWDIGAYEYVDPLVGTGTFNTVRFGP